MLRKIAKLMLSVINLAATVFLSDALVKLGTNSFKIFTITAASISCRQSRS